MLLTAALAGIAPLAAVNIWLLSDVAFSRAYWVVLLLLMEAPWATAPLTLVLGDLMFGVRPRPGRILKATHCLAAQTWSSHSSWSEGCCF